MYWNSLNQHLRQTYGGKLYKLALSSGCSCPNRDGTLGTGGCIFCDGAGAFAERGDVAQQIRLGKERVAAKAKNCVGYIAYFQSFTNTYGAPEQLRKLYLQALAEPDIAVLSIATRPDCLPRPILDLLEELNSIKPVWVELGLQTIHPASAAYIRRGYELAVYDRAVEQLKNRSITVITHQILGLPGESVEDMAATARYIGASGAEGVKFHLLHVLRGTELEREWREGRVPVMELHDYIAALEACIAQLPPSVVIHRLTGDGAKRDLLSPLWSGDKKRVLNAIYAAFSRDDVEQGSALTEGKGRCYNGQN